MASPTSPGGQEAQTFCGFCGYTDAQRFTFCPNCGRPVGTFSGQMGVNEQTRPSAPLGMNEQTRPSRAFGTSTGEMFGAAPTQPGTNPYEGWNPGAYGATPTQPGSNPYVPGNQFPPATASAGGPGASFYGAQGWQGGPAGPVSGQVTTGPQGKRHWSRGRRIGVISGALLALLIVGTVGAYFVYTAFFAYSPVDSARYLPANTLVYTSFDLQQIAQNKHNVSQQDVSGATNTSGFEQATGLDFQKDVAPWIKRSFSFSLVSVTNQPAANGFGTQMVYGTVFLISTHDTNASQATIQKIITTQEQKYGVKFTSISYQGTTLQSDVDSVNGQQSDTFNPTGTASPLVLGIVKDQVIIANTVAIAEGVVDRANGHGDTLAQDSTFTTAMGKLAGDRFGTLYVNVHQLLQDLKILGPSSDSGQLGLNSYQVGYGSLQFTDAGMRLSFTLEVKGGKSYDLSGNSNASAGVVPSSAILYEGLGNLNGFYQEVKDESGGLVTDQGFQNALGLSPNDELFHSPVSLALLTPSADSSDVIDPLVMLHSSLDAATINAKVQQALGTLGYASSAATVDGTQATKVQADGTTVYYEVLGHDLVFAYDADGLSQAIDTFNGKVGSLAASATFKALVSQAPQNNQETLFISLENLANAPGTLGQTYHELVGSTGLLTKVTASYLTYNGDGNGVTITEDIALK